MLLLPLLLFCLSLGCHADQPFVSLRNGTVLGTLVSVGGRTARQFLGIPFAQPPTGALRFDRPRSIAAAWNLPLNATRPPNRCPQVEFLPITFDAFLPKEMVPKMDEDCLSLSIWTPVAASKPKLKAVMVWFHGGAYLMGDGFPTHNGAALAALEDVVVVTPNYRLGVLGFLRLGHKVAGNWGMWDQQLALRWVQGNIAAFGGDPDLVTLFGESAGSTSASLHLLNSDSSALFRRAILHSGSYASHWAMNPNSKALEKVHRRFSASFGCRGSETATVECLRRKSAEDLTAHQLRVSPEIVWLPISDGRFVKGLSWLRRKPNKEVMIGVCQEEGMFSFNLMLAEHNGSVDLALDALLENSPFMRIDYFPSRLTRREKAAIRRLLQSHGDLTNRTQQIRRAATPLGDVAVVCPANEMADDIVSIGGTVYMFEFAHRSSYSRLPAGFGATHWDDVAYVFGLQELYPAAFNATWEEKQLAREMMREVASFAKQGQPASKSWRPFSRITKDFFRFARPSKPRRGGLRRNECALWSEVLPRLMVRGARRNLENSVTPFLTCGSVRSAQSPSIRRAWIVALVTAVILALRRP